jgi:hypothetical protein
MGKHRIIKFKKVGREWKEVRTVVSCLDADTAREVINLVSELNTDPEIQYAIG